MHSGSYQVSVVVFNVIVESYFIQELSSGNYPALMQSSADTQHNPPWVSLSFEFDSFGLVTI